MSNSVPTSDSIESALIDLTGLSNLTLRALEAHLCRDPEVLGSKELRQIAEDDANGIMHGALKIDADLRDLRDQFSEYVEAAAKREEAAPAVVRAERSLDQMSTDWADAVVQMAQALNYRQQMAVFELVERLEDIALDACRSWGQFTAGARPVANEIIKSLTYIRECICMAAEDSDVISADDQEEANRAALLLRWYGGDPASNAAEIMALVGPFMPTYRAPPRTLAQKEQGALVRLCEQCLKHIAEHKAIFSATSTKDKSHEEQTILERSQKAAADAYWSAHVQPLLFAIRAMPADSLMAFGYKAKVILAADVKTNGEPLAVDTANGMLSELVEMFGEPEEEAGASSEDGNDEGEADDVQEAA